MIFFITFFRVVDNIYIGGILSIYKFRYKYNKYKYLQKIFVDFPQKKGYALLYEKTWKFLETWSDIKVPSYISLHKSLKNPPVRQQSLVDQPYEYNYLLPVINTASTITSAQNKDVLSTASLVANAASEATNNAIFIAYSSGSSNPHGFLTVTFRANSGPVDILSFPVNAPVGNIILFKTEGIVRVTVTNNTGTSLGIGIFFGIGTQKTPPNHPYV